MGRRDAGMPPCMNMLWSHALPIPVFQPSFNLRFCGHEWKIMKAMLADLSMGLCCVIRVVVCKCCGLSMAVPMANSPTPSLQHNYSNHCADTPYQCNKTYKHPFDRRLHCTWCTCVQPCKPVECKIQSMTVLQKSTRKRSVQLPCVWVKPQT